MARNVQLVVIDPQYDFMDYPDSALPVPGAHDDMVQLAAMVDRIGNKLDDIHVTLDSHQLVDVGHPTFQTAKSTFLQRCFLIISMAGHKERL